MGEDHILKFQVDGESFADNFQPDDDPVIIEIPDELQVFSRKQLVVFRNGTAIVQTISHNKKYTSTTGLRVLRLVQRLPYKSRENKYTNDDLAYCAKSFPGISKIYQIQLEAIKMAITAYIALLEDCLNATVTLKTLIVTCAEFCHDGPLAPDQEEYNRRFERAASRRFGFMAEKTTYGRKKSDGTRRWQIHLNRKAGEPRKDGEALWLKHYEDREQFADRIEFRHENPAIFSDHIESVFAGLNELGDLAHDRIQLLLADSTTVEPPVPVTALKKKLLSIGFSRTDFKSDRLRRLIFEVTTCRTYTPSKYPLDEVVSRSRMERLSDETHGIFIRRPIEDAQGRPTNRAVYELRDDWESVDVSKYVSRWSGRKPYTDEAIEEIKRNAVRDALAPKKPA